MYVNTDYLTNLLTYLLTNRLNTWSRLLIDKHSHSATQIPCPSENFRFITVFTRAVSVLSHANSVHFYMHYILKLLILSLICDWGHHVVSPLQDFWLVFCIHTTSPMHTTCPVHLIIINLIILISGKDWKLCSSSIHNFLQSPVTSILLGPNIHLKCLIFTGKLLNAFSVRFFIWKSKSKVVSVLN
jgi:hypothetical protein